MQIQVNTERNIRGDDALSAEVVRAVEGTLSRFSDHITRIEVHLSDEKSNKKARGYGDIRWVMEARLEGRQPIAVTLRAATSVEGASDKLTRLIASGDCAPTVSTETHRAMPRNFLHRDERHHGKSATQYW